MRKLKAFTLVELLIVVVIIGILATFVIITVTAGVRKTRNARAIDSVGKVRESLEAYASINGGFTALNGACGAPAANAAFANVTVACGNALIAGGTTGFSTVPQDGQNPSAAVQMKITDAANGYFSIKGVSADSTTKCWYYKKGATVISDLSVAAPLACTNAD